LRISQVTVVELGQRLPNRHFRSPWGKRRMTKERNVTFDSHKKLARLKIKEF